MDSIVVWYSETNSGLSSNNRNFFQRDLLNASLVRERVCNDFSTIFFFIFRHFFHLTAPFSSSILFLILRLSLLNFFSLNNLISFLDEGSEKCLEKTSFEQVRLEGVSWIQLAKDR
jgi:hypothetical protein